MSQQLPDRAGVSQSSCSKDGQQASQWGMPGASGPLCSVPIPLEWALTLPQSTQATGLSRPVLTALSAVPDSSLQHTLLFHLVTAWKEAWSVVENTRTAAPAPVQGSPASQVTQL